ncbi:hypothetical protein Q7P37_010602 [Cladosporium fusiforme]
MEEAKEFQSHLVMAKSKFSKQGDCEWRLTISFLSKHLFAVAFSHLSVPPFLHPGIDREQSFDMWGQWCIQERQHQTFLFWDYLVIVGHLRCPSKGYVDSPACPSASPLLSHFRSQMDHRHDLLPEDPSSYSKMTVLHTVQTRITSSTLQHTLTLIRGNRPDSNTQSIDGNWCLQKAFINVLGYQETTIVKRQRNAEDSARNQHRQRENST